MEGYAAGHRELVDSSRRTAILCQGLVVSIKCILNLLESRRRAVAIVPLPSLSVLSASGPEALAPAQGSSRPAVQLRYGRAIGGRLVFVSAPP